MHIVVQPKPTGVTIDGRYFKLQPAAVHVLQLLLKAKGETVTYEQFGNRRSTSMHVFRLRDKLPGEIKIRNELDVGYSLTINKEA